MTTTFGVEGTFARALIRDWSFYLQAGVSRSDYSFLNDQLQPVDNADTSFTYISASGSAPSETPSTSIWPRIRAPNSSGFLTLAREFHIYVSRAMTQRLRGEIGLRSYATRHSTTSSPTTNVTTASGPRPWSGRSGEQLFLNGGYGSRNSSCSHARIQRRIVELRIGRPRLAWTCAPVALTPALPCGVAAAARRLIGAAEEPDL